MAIDGIIFDLDGTLLDTNRLHTRAWAQAFAESGFYLGEDRIALEIGKGGSMLVPTLVGQKAEDEQGEELREEHGRRYRQLIQDGVRVYPRVEELIQACRDRGLRIAVATASKQENLEKVLDAAGLDLTAMVDDVVTDSDVEKSKPHDDVVVAACEKLGLAPGQCVMVGDTPYDGQAAASAGVSCIGLLTGSHGEDAMWASGMRALYQDTADLLDHLDEALKAASPGQGRLTDDFLEEMMKEARQEAEASVENGGAPDGAILTRSDGSVLARARSEIAAVGQPLAHAAAELLRRATTEQLRHDDLVLVTTVEPCAMCFGAAVEARIDTVVFSGENDRTMSSWRMCSPGPSAKSRFPRVISGIGRGGVDNLMAEWRARRGAGAALEG